MMVLPLLLITVLPKMMNDPETKREMEQMHQSMNVQNQVISNIDNQVKIDVKCKLLFSWPNNFYFYDFIQVPEISEIMANLFGGGGSGGTSADKAKKKQKPHVTRRS